MVNILAFGVPGPMEMAVVGIIAVLLFGTRLPTVARSLGQSLFSFKKGMKEVEAECNEMDKALKDGARDIESSFRS